MYGGQNEGGGGVGVGGLGEKSEDLSFMLKKTPGIIGEIKVNINYGSKVITIFLQSKKM